MASKIRTNDREELDLMANAAMNIKLKLWKKEKLASKIERNENLKI